jgi:small-conductance mechanosensitive channel
MEKLESSAETIGDRKEKFEQWKKELADRETSFTQTKNSKKRELESLRKEMDRVTESATTLLNEIYASIEEKKGRIKEETEKPFEDADLDMIRSLMDVLEKLYSSSQEIQDLITDNYQINRELQDKITDLEGELENDLKKE